jgi:hypothetical protein
VSDEQITERKGGSMNETKVSKQCDEQGHAFIPLVVFTETTRDITKDKIEVTVTRQTFLMACAHCGFAVQATAADPQ